MRLQRPSSLICSYPICKLGSIDFRDGNWQGFWGTDFEGVIDLGELITIKNISANFYQYNNSWIFFPKYIEAWTSEDNLNWTKWGETSSTINPEKRGKLIQTFSIENITTTTRYIKLIAKTDL